MSEEDENFRWINTAKSYASHTAQFFHSFNFPEEKQVGRNLKKYPIIRLEILSAASMKNLIFVSYVIFIISLILSSFERSLRRSTENLDQIKIDKNGAMAVWNKKFSVNLNNRFFELNGFIDSFKIKSQNAQFRFDFGVDLSVISKNGEKLRNWNSSVYFGYSRYNKDKNIIFVSEEKSPFGYYWQDKIFESGGSNEDLVILNIQIFLKNFSIENVDDDISIKMKFVKTNNAYVVSKFLINIFLFCTTFSIFIFYSFAIQMSSRTVTEQKLICLLFLAMLLFQTATICYSNPIKLNYLSLVENRYFFTTLGNVLQTISTILLVSFILLIADLINRISLNYSIFELLTKYKISLALTNSISSLSAMLISTFWEMTKKSKKSSFTVSVIYFVCTTLWMTSSIALVIWISKLFWSAYQELQYWNYKATRFRQLSFRFFVTQSYFVLLYIIFVWLIWYISGDKLFNSNKNPLSGLGTNLILSSFTIVCAFVHLPLREKDLSQYSIYRNEYEDSGFSLKVARLMCHLSWQAYGIPKGIETDNPNEYPVNLEDSSLNLYEIGQSKDYDVQWLIAEGKGIVTVAFRGSISFVNVTTNLRIYHRLVNNNFWYTGDLRFISPSQQKMQHGSTMVHAGFLQSYLVVRKSVFKFLNALARDKNKETIFYFTGHSLGAALATLCCLETRCRMGCDVRLYTFGSPRVGCSSFSNLFRALIPKNDCFRIVFERDIVTAYPTELASYRHVDSEVYMNRAGNIIFAPNVVEKSLMPSKTSIEDHLLANYRKAIDMACLQLNIEKTKKIDFIEEAEIGQSDGI